MIKSSVTDVDAVQMIAIGSVICEYGLLKMIDKSRQDLRIKAQNAINACQRVQ